MNCGTSEMSTCQPLLKGRNSWNNALGRGWSRKLWKSPLAETGSMRTAKAAHGVEQTYRLGSPCWSQRSILSFITRPAVITVALSAVVKSSAYVLKWIWTYWIPCLCVSRKSMAATRWPAPRASSTSVGCVWAYSAGSTHTVTLTTHVHPVTTSEWFVFSFWWHHSLSLTLFVAVREHLSTVKPVFSPPASDSSTVWTLMKKMPSGVMRKTDTGAAPHCSILHLNALYHTWPTMSAFTQQRHNSFVPFFKSFIWSGAVVWSIQCLTLKVQGQPGPEQFILYLGEK